MSAKTPEGWVNKRASVIERLKKAGFDSHVDANAVAIEQSLLGQGPDAAAPDVSSGARIVFNIPSPYVLPFVRESQQANNSQSDASKPYKNGYDLGKLHIGLAPKHPPKPRELVDRAIAAASGLEQKDIYYSAVELNGAGVRFYGDFCLVLKPEFNDGVTILESNSYDLIRDPLKAKIEASPNAAQERISQAGQMKGVWMPDLGKIAGIKVLEVCGARNRRLTTGLISDAVLQDEDYIEVLKAESFSTEDLQEARTSAADTASENHILQRTFTGPSPRFASLLWAMRRRRAEAALKSAGVPVRVVTLSGRIKS